MKKIKKVPIPGAHVLSAPEMNHIHVCTGNHSPIPPKEAAPTPGGQKA